MFLTPYGLREWLTISIVAIVVALVGGVLLTWWIALPVGIVWFALLMFYREPPRRIPRDLTPEDLLAPCDGVVSAVLTLEKHPALGRDAAVVRVFMSVLNVHVNRAPCDGDVIGMIYTRGQFLNAQTEESSQVNENRLTMLRRTDGTILGVRQISGMIARRIVCGVDLGAPLRRGEKFGMIKFGSTTEIILPRPEDVTVHVKPGDRVKAGLTVLARLAASPHATKEETPCCHDAGEEA